MPAPGSEDAFVSDDAASDCDPRTAFSTKVSRTAAASTTARMATALAMSAAARVESNDSESSLVSSSSAQTFAAAIPTDVRCARVGTSTRPTADASSRCLHARTQDVTPPQATLTRAVTASSHPVAVCCTCSTRAVGMPTS